MKKLVFFFIGTLAYCLISASAKAQAPQAFPYQAIARNVNGDLLSNQAILMRMSVLDITSAGAVLYRETHAITTNSLGLFTLNIGQGTVVNGIFANINWASEAKFIKVEMDVTGIGASYITMGTTQLLSVPYAIYSNSTASLPNGTNTNTSLRWNNATSSWLPDATLYNNGTNIGIGTTTPTTKLEVAGQVKITGGTPGVGKLLTSDATGLATWNTPSSIGTTLDSAYDFGGRGLGRIINADSGALKIQGQDGLQVTGTFGSGDDIDISGAGTRMFFNPKKSAFRAGTAGLAYWDKDSTGDYSFAGGSSTMAKGNYSIAFGFGSKAKGLYSNASGNFTEARGNYSVAMGNNSVASGAGSTAMSDFTTANANYSTSMGFHTTANGAAGLVVGLYNDTILSPETFVGATTPLFIVGNGSGTTALSNAMVVRYDGNVGIGTNTPATKLDVNGQVKITGGTPGAGKVLTSDATGLASWVTPTVLPSDISGTINKIIKFTGATTGGNSQMIDDGTNVGIGSATSLPISKVQINSATTFTDIRFTNATTGHNITDGLQIYNQGTQASILNKENAALDFGTNNSTRMTIDATGNLGIGTATPTTKLEVAGQVKITGGTPGAGKVLTSDALGLATWAAAVPGATGATGATGPQGIQGLTGATGAANIAGTTNSLIKFTNGTTGGNSQVFDNGTNVGIGTNTPTSKLEINGQLRITGGSPSAGKILTSDATGLASWTTPTIAGSLNDAYNFGGNGNGKVITANDGAVKISGEDGFEVIGTYGSGIEPEIDGDGSRMFFNPRKSAFRAGYTNTNKWDKDSIGNYSFASGHSTLASGTYATAIGFFTRATGSTSTAIGNSANASGTYAVAIGTGAEAIGANSIALGWDSRSIGYNSTAIGGLDATANGTRSISMGDNTISNAYGGLAIGRYNDTIVSTQTSLDPLTPLFIIGNGSAQFLRSNAMVVRNDGHVGIGINDPKSTLEVNGTMGYQLSVQAGATPVTLDNSSSILYFTDLTSSIILPTASDCLNRMYTIVNRTSANKTISTFVNLSGGNQVIVSSNSSIDVISDGTNWLKIR